MAFVFARKGGRLPGGEYRVELEAEEGEEAEAMVLHYSKPTTPEILEIATAVSRVDAKLMRFQRSLQEYVYSEDEKDVDKVAVNITEAELAPLVAWTAGFITSIEGVVDENGDPLKLDDLDEGELELMLFSLLDGRRLLELAGAIKNCAGLTPAAKKKSKPISS